MKLLISILALGLVFSSFAQDSAKFEEHKKMIVAELEKGISLMQTEKSCVENAKVREDIKKCHEATKAEREKLHSERKQKRAEMLDEGIKKLEEKKAKLEEQKKKN